MAAVTEEFNTIQFEKRLTSLKDSQENINACCKWCLENRQHHKKIVTSWLNVLKRVKVEQRLNLFYLANDVIQYSKRKQYEFVDSWGTALQKATTLVRDDKVKHKIVRIFNIWQQRGVYSEEFISDLCGLISVVPTATKSDEPHEFQSNYVVNKIKQCAKLENETDLKLKVLKEHNPKIQLESESLCVSLKDRAHVDDVEKELEVYVKHLDGYINALKAEIKCRITNISVLKQANNQLDKDKKDVKVVANAYRLFGNKVKAFQRKLDEHRATLASPIPSPDINAPSPSPDCDIELPDDNEDSKIDPAMYTAGFYNPVPPPPTTTSASFVNNGYTSFMGSSFNTQSMPSLFSNNQSSLKNTSTTDNGNYNFNITNVLQSMNQPPPPPSEAPTENSRFQFHEGPLLPPPMPPFSAKSDYDGSFQSTYDKTYVNPDEYNPEQEPEIWESMDSWNQSQTDTDTPESPPIFEKQGYVEGVEYHDNLVSSGASDVDHRILDPSELGPIRGRKDVDHRNLISLTGSPVINNTDLTHADTWTPSSEDKDFRLEPPPESMDQDYRMPNFIEQLKLPPPPPPPPKQLLPPPNHHGKKQTSPRKVQDNIESIDMELSSEEDDGTDLDSNHRAMLQPPPPLPDLPDDVDANTFLDDLDNDLNSNEFMANLQDSEMPMALPPTNMPPPNMHWGPPPQQNFGFRRGGRFSSNNNNNHVHRGRGRGTYGFRGANNFRGRGFSRGRGHKRGRFQGGY